MQFMLGIRIRTIRMVTCCWLMYSGTVAFAGAPADLVLENGRFYLREDGWAQAVAIHDGAIVAIGDDAAIVDWKGTGTQVVNLGGRAVLPGFHDMHVHPQFGGFTQQQCKIPHGSAPDQIRKVVKDCAADKKKGEWIIGRGWTQSVFDDIGGAHKSLLDEAAPDNPVLLGDETGHSSWANSAALKIAGITRDTPNPAVGVIEHDSTGEPNGLLRESAGWMVRAFVPEATEQQSEDALRFGFETLLANGITSIRDAAVGTLLGTQADPMAPLAVYASLYDQGVKMPRSELCLVWVYDISGDDAGFEARYAQRNLYRRPLVSPSCVKLIGDGVPGDGHTAFMLEPYEGVEESDPEQYKYGFMNVPPVVVKKLVPRFDADGISMLIHCCGDACARTAVDAIELARKQNGYSGRMHQVGHNNFTKKVDLERGSKLGVGFEFSAYLYYYSPATQTYLTAIGEERFERYKPVKDAFDAGAVVMTGSDWPVAATPNPWIAVETLVTRERPGGGGRKLGQTQTLNLDQVIDMYTVNAAKQMGHADRVGRIRVGYLADLIVLNQNPFEVPATQLHETEVDMTLVNGEFVYQR